MFEKRNFPLLLLIALFIVSTLCTAIGSIVYVRSVRQWRAAQSQANAINNNQNLLRALAADTVEYSKKNPAINPLLQAAGLKQITAPTAGVKGK